MLDTTINTSKTIFISDLHLCENKPDLSSLFIKFLNNIEHDILNNKYKLDSLYILGDFFNYWVGSDCTENWHTEIITAIQKISNICPVYFLAGNRDFHVNQKTADLFNFKLINQDVKLLDLYDNKIIILHGDTLCTKDVSYQRFRKFVRSPIIKFIYLSLPLKLRKNIAQKLKDQSTKNYNNNQKNLEIFDVTESAVESLFKQYNTNIMIHGHTHRPKVHKYNFNNSEYSEYTRYVLGDWHADGAYYLEITNKDNQPASFKLKNINYHTKNL